MEENKHDEFNPAKLTVKGKVVFVVVAILFVLGVKAGIGAVIDSVMGNARNDSSASETKLGPAQTFNSYSDGENAYLDKLSSNESDYPGLQNFSESERLQWASATCDALGDGVSSWSVLDSWDRTSQNSSYDNRMAGLAMTVAAVAEVCPEYFNDFESTYADYFGTE